MSKKAQKERMLELLADNAMFGLNSAEKAELKSLREIFPELKSDKSFERAAAAVSLSKVNPDENIPAALRSKILSRSKDFVTEDTSVKERSSVADSVSAATSEPEKTPFWQWLTPVFAAVGCIALLANIWVTYNRGELENAGKDDPKVVEPKVLTPSEKRQKLLASKGIVKTAWTSPKKDKNLSGEVIWSDEKQEGYMTFKGLAKNDASKETYQLWIFDETQSEKTPVDGGIFDIEKDGEIIIPIDAKLKVRKPAAFAITVEKPGGVVVSKREKVIALAKVEA